MTQADFIKNHPTVQAMQGRELLNSSNVKLSREELLMWTLAAGADDVGIVPLESDAFPQLHFLAGTISEKVCMPWWRTMS